MTQDATCQRLTEFLGVLAFSGMRTAIMVAGAVLACIVSVQAQESRELSEARVSYNAFDFDRAISLAAAARQDPVEADAASVLIARAYLGRYDQGTDPIDLSFAREALASVNASQLNRVDRAAWLVGFGQILYLDGRPGVAAEVFETALAITPDMPAADERTLLDWWATALDREAFSSTPRRRVELGEQIGTRMLAELAVSPGGAVPNYWLVASARTAGQFERAWDSAAAAWIRSRLDPASAPRLRDDLDRLVVEGIVPGLARARADAGLEGDVETLLEAWARFKDEWP